MAEPGMRGEFPELHDFCKDPTAAAMLVADVKAWLDANPGWEKWDVEVRLTRFSVWLGDRHARTPDSRALVADERAREATLAA
jgi:hypothetical protein